MHLVKFQISHGDETQLEAYESDRGKSVYCITQMFLPLSGGIRVKFFNSIINSIGCSILIYKSKVIIIIIIIIIIITIII